jgi:hypothetical protein
MFPPLISTWKLVVEVPNLKYGDVEISVMNPLPTVIVLPIFDNVNPPIVLLDPLADTKLLDVVVLLLLIFPLLISYKTGLVELSRIYWEKVMPDTSMIPPTTPPPPPPLPDEKFPVTRRSPKIVALPSEIARR